MPKPDETEEWLDELVERWSEVYKKSMATVVLLRIVGRGDPVGVDIIAAAFAARTGWTLTERGLYRTLRRLTLDGLLDVQEVPAPRTGAMRKQFTLTVLGERFLTEIEARTVPPAGRASHRSG